jgi:hypothetical protein
VPAVAQWNVSLVVAALSGGGDKGLESVSTVFSHEGDLFGELPILRAALGHPNASVRLLAEHIPMNRSRAFFADDAERCERHLQSHPDEFAVRLALLQYYFLRSHEFPVERAARERHILWVIEHRPASHTAGSPDCYLFRDAGKPYECAKNLWLRHVDSGNVQANVLGNAAHFFLLNEPNCSEQLFRRAKQLDPDNPKWSEQLGHLYHLRCSRRLPAERRADASLALDQFEEALRLSVDQFGRASTLIDLVKTAYDAGEWARARQAAEDLLQVATARYNPADMLHAAHCVLGRLALRDRDVNEAKRRLVLAADALTSNGGIQASGPRELWLARELLEGGERRAVIEYLQQCSPAWQDTHHCAEVWAAAVERGEMPDFGHNLE